MTRSLHLVSTAFIASGIVLGLPGVLAFACLAYASISLRLSAQHRVPAAAASSNSLLDMLLGLIGALGRGVGFWTDAVQWVATVLAVLSFVLVLVALALFFTGQGLRAQRAWARIVGLLLLSGLFLLSTLSFLVLRDLTRLAAVLLMGATASAIWTLWRRFA